MARERTGTLVPPRSKRDNFVARVTRDLLDADGAPVRDASGRKRTVRELYDLGTRDPAQAERRKAKLVRDLAAGKAPSVAARSAGAPDTVSEYAERHFAAREARRVSMVPTERGNFVNHIAPVLGPRTMASVTSSDVRAVLERAMTAGLRRNTLKSIHGVMHRMFDEAWRAELISENPVARVRVPDVEEETKVRVILTDEEFVKLVMHPGTDDELRMLALVARTVGGMRASDLNRWDWSMLDRVHFETCFIPKGRKGKRKVNRPPRELEIPEPVRPILRARWEAAGKPESGPVFPTEKGKRAGEFRTVRGASFAKRLRRGLIRAGVFRMPPTVEHTEARFSKSTATRTRSVVTPHPRDPLYHETATTMPVDFHSFRRAFNTALAEAGVNVQQAMHLSGHTDPNVHMRYVQSTGAMRRAPASAIPALPPGLHEACPQGLETSQSATIDSGADPQVPDSIEPSTGLEPVTCGLRIARNAPQTPCFEADCESQALSVRHVDPHSYRLTVEQSSQVSQERQALLTAIGVAASAGDAATVALLATELARLAR